MNHPAIYAPIWQEIVQKDRVMYQQMRDYYQQCLPYRMGLAIMTPYRKLKKILGRKVYENE